MGVEGIDLPPGFRFYPTDEELVVHYLCKKSASQPFAVPVIAEVEIYKFNPWDLPGKALFGEKEWYFFSPRDRKYPNGSRPNRAAASGYWKATGTDKSITSGGGRKVGLKKTLVFYQGKPTKGVKTNWIMHEYCLPDSASRAAKRKGSLRLDDWVLCRVYKKVYGARKEALAEKRNGESSWREDSQAPTNLSRSNKLNRMESAMQYDHNPFHNGAAAADSRKSVGCCPNLAKNGRMEQRCNGGATHADRAAVAEAGSTTENQETQRQNHDVYLESRAPALLQMDSSTWVSMEATAEGIRQISDCSLQRLPSLQMLFGLDFSESAFALLEPIPPLGDDEAFFTTM